VTAAVLVSVVCLALVLAVAWPLVRGAGAEPAPSPGDRRRQAVEEELARSFEAIREIEADHRAGNLSDEDFAELDRDERARAVELMRRRDALAAEEPPA
jgi:hypothetical protein